jgi:Skp family chaperone for outer membrane proteins
MFILCVSSITYIETNIKRSDIMGIFFVYFAGKPADKLKAMKAKRESKIAKLQAEVNAIEIELSKKQKEK